MGDESGIVVTGDADESDGGDQVGGNIVDVAGGENVLEEIDLSGHVGQRSLSVEHSCSSVRKVHSVL